MAMTTSDKGINLIKSFEGYRSQAYQDSVGVWTIGYGTTSGVMKGQIINEGQAVTYLRADLAKFEKVINESVTVPLKQNQFDALACFVYNVGPGNFKSSTLLKLLNAGKYNDAANQFIRWNKAGGKELAGLTRRRNAEADLFRAQ